MSMFKKENVPVSRYLIASLGIDTALGSGVLQVQLTKKKDLAHTIRPDAQNARKRDEKFAAYSKIDVILKRP